MSRGPGQEASTQIGHGDFRRSEPKPHEPANQQGPSSIRTGDGEQAAAQHRLGDRDIGGAERARSSQH